MSTAASPQHPPPPLISVPSVVEPSDDECSSSSEADMMTVEEEEAARRYLLGSGGEATDGRRPSSLDVYMATQQGPQSEPMLLNRRTSLRHEEEEIAHIDYDAQEREEKEKQRQKIEHEREMIKEDRRRKTLLKEQAEKERTEFEERMKVRRKMRKGLGGLSREKKKRLKEMIMNKAHEEIILERRRVEEEKTRHLTGIVPTLDIDDMSEKELVAKVEELYARLKKSESDKFDWEQRLRRQDYEIQQLTQKMSEMKGKYVKPVLKKVAKLETRTQKLLRLKNRAMSEEPSACKLKLKNTNSNRFVLNNDGRKSALPESVAEAP